MHFLFSIWKYRESGSAGAWMPVTDPAFTGAQSFRLCGPVTEKNWGSDYICEVTDILGASDITEVYHMIITK